jgi:hypothetical protein
MRERGRRLDHVEPELEALEERRGGCGRVDRGTDVMSEARERQLGGASPTADGVASLDEEDRASGLRERDRGGEAVRPRADDDGV